MKKVEDYVVSIPDFPEPGIIFRDVTSVLQNAEGLKLAIDGIQEKLDGLDRREKFRIRCYDGNYSCIRLEKKSKINGLCGKESAPLTAGEVRGLLAGERAWMTGSGRNLVWELCSKMTAQRLGPKTIVDYTREAFVL